MIEAIEDLPVGTLGFRFTGKVTGKDYDTVLTPAIESALETFDRIKFLAQIGPGFEGYGLDAAWDDTQLGLRHWRGFERVAVVTDAQPVRMLVKGISFVSPCPVSLFPLADLEEAKRWLSESLGSIRLEAEDRYIQVQLIGKLEPSAYDGVSDEIDGLMSGADPVRLLLDLREFDGWSGLSALGDHLSLVRDHRRVPERIAIIGDRTWQRLAEKVLSQFVNARTMFFEADDVEGAKAWIRA